MRSLPLLSALAAAAAVVSLAAVPAADARSAGATPAETHRVVVRPVHADGTPATGWTVRRQRGLTVTCDGSSVSAVDDGITTCLPAAAYAPSCWKSRRHTVLCLRDPQAKTLVRLRYSGDYPSATAPDRAAPQGLTLGDGQDCTIRVGGAWGAPTSHPDWIGFYSCDNGSVYAPSGSRDGIIRRTSPWRVRIWVAGTEDTLVRRQVPTAYFVGMAG